MADHDRRYRDVWFEGKTVIYDVENKHAWIQSNYAIEMSEMHALPE